MNDQLCVRDACRRPTPDGYACPNCTRRAAVQLAAIIEFTPAARDVAQRQTRRGTGGGGGGGKPGSTVPLDLGATARLDSAQAKITGWVRHALSVRGPQSASVATEGRLHRDPLARACSALTWHLEWARHRKEIVDLLADIEAVLHIVRGIARGPAAQRYLGPCSTTCNGDVYGPDGGTTGWCRTCGNRYDQHERQQYLAELTHDRAYRAAHIAHAHDIPVKTIRSWAHRGRLRSWWFDGDQIQLWEEPEPPTPLPATRDATDEEQAAHDARLAEIDAELRARGPRLHVVADVLALHHADTQRRAIHHTETEV